MSKTSNKVLKGLGFAAFLIFFTGLGYWIGKMGASSLNSISPKVMITLAVLVIPLFFIAIGIHEAGHAFAGIRVRFDFRMYVVGPLMWTRNQEGWTFKWNKNVNTAGGMVICIPTDTQNLQKRFSIYAAGGPVASLVLALLAYGAYYWISSTINMQHVLLQIIAYSLLIMAFLSLVIFLLTAIPMHFGGFSSDGARVLRFLRGRDRARLEILMLRIIASSTSGIRPRSLDVGTLQEALALATKLHSHFGVYLHSYLHQVAFDQHDLPLAEKHLLDYIQEADAIPQGLRNMVWLDAAFFYAFGKNDLEEAQKYWQQFKPTGMIPKALVFATEAALAALQNDSDLALKKIDSALQEIPDVMDKGAGMALQDKLLELKDRVMQTSPSFSISTASN